MLLKKIMHGLFLCVFSFSACIAERQANNNTITLIKPYSMEAFDKDIRRFYASIPRNQSNDSQNRLRDASGFFLGKPYVSGPLGEGKEALFDKNPLYRTDSFDCMTYVSTVLALLESADLESFRHHMIQINYHGNRVSFATRNHFASIDWNPVNEKNGYIKDITQQLFPDTYQVAQTVIDKPAWFKHLSARQIKYFAPLPPAQLQRLLNQLHHLGDQMQPQVSHVTYEPLSSLFDEKSQARQAMFKRIPDGVIIEIVRPGWDLTRLIGTRLNISHMGFGLRMHHQLIFREASSTEKKVVDVPLQQYLKNYLHSPTVKGIHIEKIIPRAASHRF